MKKAFLVLIVLFYFSCKKENIDDGYYLKKDYLEYQDTLTNKGFELNQSNILLKVSHDTVFNWGDIKYWENYSTKQKFPFRKIRYKGKTRYFFDLKYNGTTESFEYVKLDSMKPPLDSLELDFTELEKIKAIKILAGTYSLNGKKVIFTNNGRVEGLNEFKNYKIYLRGGTNFPFPGLNFIQTNNGVWKFYISNNLITFIRFADKRNEMTEVYDLTKEKIQLTRLKNN